MDLQYSEPFGGKIKWYGKKGMDLQYSEPLMGKIKWTDKNEWINSMREGGSRTLYG